MIRAGTIVNISNKIIASLELAVLIASLELAAVIASLGLAAHE